MLSFRWSTFPSALADGSADRSIDGDDPMTAWRSRRSCAGALAGHGGGQCSLLHQKRGNADNQDILRGNPAFRLATECWQPVDSPVMRSLVGNDMGVHDPVTFPVSTRVHGWQLPGGAGTPRRGALYTGAPSLQRELHCRYCPVAASSCHNPIRTFVWKTR